MSEKPNILSGALNNLRRPLWMARARRLLARGRFSDAALWCEMVLELDRTDTAARELLQRVRVSMLERSARRTAEDAEPSLADEREAAFWSVEAERPREAGLHARRALRLHARLNRGAKLPPELMLARGQVSYLQGWYARALSELQAARMPGFAGFETTYYLGLTYLALGRTADCLRHFGELVRKHPWLAADRLYDLLESRDEDE